MSTPAFFLLLLPLLGAFLILQSSSSAAAPEDQMNPMQQASEADMVRLAGYGDERLSSVLVTGSLLCEACLQAGSQLTTSHVRGAKLVVACKAEGSRRRSNCAYGTTDEYGEFIIDLPSKLHAMPKLEDACVVRVLRMPRNSLCRHVSGVNPRRMRLSSVGNSIRVYTIGTVRASLMIRGKTASHQCLVRTNADEMQSSTW